MTETRIDVTRPRRDPLAVRGADLYETPAVAVHALLSAVALPPVIWEPACGPGAVTRILRAAGHTVVATDLVDYASPDQTAAGVDFLEIRDGAGRRSGHRHESTLQPGR